MPAEVYEPELELLEREQIDDLQTRLLQTQVARVCAGSRLFREKLDAAGAENGDIRGAADLAGLPVVTKEELRADQAAHPPFGTFAVADQTAFRELHPSTGTTGTPVLTIWSESDVEAITAVTARMHWQLGIRPGDVVQNAWAYGLWVAGLSAHYAAARLGCLVVPTGTSTATERQLEFLSAVGSTVLFATPSYALHMAEGLRRHGIDPATLALRIGAFGGEAGAENPATRRALEDGLGLAAFDYYGLAEIGPTFAAECEAKAGLHFAEDYVIVEAVDPETRRPVPDGELGVLVFTHLAREATPMLRYWSNDYARLSRERCACGRTHVRAVGGIVGRHDDLVVFKGAKFYPSQVEKVVRATPGCTHEFRVELSRPAPDAPVERCVVVVEAAAAVDEPALVHDLRSELGVTPAVRVEPAGTLERTMFKARRVVEV